VKHYEKQTGKRRMEKIGVGMETVLVRYKESK
jgi:hypothetical protein